MSDTTFERVSRASEAASWGRDPSKRRPVTGESAFKDAGGTEKRSLGKEGSQEHRTRKKEEGLRGSGAKLNFLAKKSFHSFLAAVRRH